MIKKRLVQFQSGKFFLTGQWDEPANANDHTPLPAVIFAHGFTGNRFESRRMFSRLSQALAQNGIRTFRFDHRGCGDSEGDFLDFNAHGLIEDLDAALAHFLQHPAIDPTRTAVVGYSLGGLSASYLLSKHPQSVTGVLWAPVAQPDIIQDRLATYPDFPRYPQKGYFDYMGFRVSADYFQNIGKLNPLHWISQFPNPILILQGETDPIVRVEQAHLYMEKRKKTTDKLQIITGGDHAFTTADNIDTVIHTTHHWLKQYLNP